jgi:hypothetical protein
VVNTVGGVVTVQNAGGGQALPPGQFGFTPATQQPPVIVPANPGSGVPPPPISAPGGSAPSAPKPGNVDCIVREAAPDRDELDGFIGGGEAEEPALALAFQQAPAPPIVAPASPSPAPSATPAAPAKKMYCS